MAFYKVIHNIGKYHDSECYEKLVNYVTSPRKTSDGGVIGSSVPPSIAPLAMKTVARVNHKEDGLKLRHSVLSFAPEDHISADEAKQIARDAMEYYADDYQILAGVHEDTDDLHIHFLMNTVNYRDGSKYAGKKEDYYQYLNFLNRITRPYGVKVTPIK